MPRIRFNIEWLAGHTLAGTPFALSYDTQPSCERPIPTAASKGVDMQDRENQMGKAIVNEMYPEAVTVHQKKESVPEEFAPEGFAPEGSTDQRKESRTDVNLTGGYISTSSGERGLINLINVSPSGLRYRLNADRNFYPAAKIQIKFTLDDFPHTVISREAVIRSVNGLYVSAEFCSTDPDDGLSHYLAQQDE
jgi:hypothetical protein